MKNLKNCNQILRRVAPQNDRKNKCHSERSEESQKYVIRFFVTYAPQNDNDR